MIHLTPAERRVIIVIALVVSISASVHITIKQFPLLKDWINLLEGEELYPKVNVNKASYEQLLNLPYIGEKTAKAIVLYREQNGFFTTVDDVANVKSVSTGNLAKFKLYLKVK